MRRYILAPEAANDLVKSGATSTPKVSLEIADWVEQAIRDKIGILAGAPGAGHWRKDLINGRAGEVLFGVLVSDRLRALSPDLGRRQYRALL